MIEAELRGSTDDRWPRFRAFAQRTFEAGGFESEERLPRMEAARQVHAALRLAHSGGPWIDSLAQLVRAVIAGQLFTSIDTSMISWLRRRALASEGQMATAVAAVLEHKDPLEAFDAFAAAVEELESGAGLPEDRRRLLRVGSLFNFACRPDRAPAVQPHLHFPLQRTLGHPWSEQVSAREQHRSCMLFALDVERRLRDDGVPVQDMIDVEALMTNAAQRQDFWAPGQQDTRPTPAYLSICAPYRDVAVDLVEWIEFHRLVGVERFFLYNNFSEDDHLDVLAPYVEDGIVCLHDWPMMPAQVETIDDCLRWHRFDSRWIAFIDTDEFLYSPTGAALPEVLREYERWPAVLVNLATFGLSGHKTRPPGLVVENYTTRLDMREKDRHAKHIVDPTRVAAGGGPHRFEYLFLSAVDEDHEPAELPLTKSHKLERLRVNHYLTKSEQEFIAKCRRQTVIGTTSRVRKVENLESMREADRQGERDETIWMYLPALRERLAGRSRPSVLRRARA